MESLGRKQPYMSLRVGMCSFVWVIWLFGDTLLQVLQFNTSQIPSQCRKLKFIVIQPILII